MVITTTLFFLETLILHKDVSMFHAYAYLFFGYSALYSQFAAIYFINAADISAELRGLYFCIVVVCIACNLSTFVCKLKFLIESVGDIISCQIRMHAQDATLCYVRQCWLVLRLSFISLNV